jgi:hypothetical protein
MPLVQSAQVATFEYGAPVAVGTVGRFGVNRGGEVDFTFANLGDDPLTVSIQVSADDSTYNATTAGNNTNAVTNLVIPAKVTQTRTVLMRNGIDKYFRIRASGGVLFQTQLRRQESAGVYEIQQ